MRSFRSGDARLVRDQTSRPLTPTWVGAMVWVVLTSSVTTAAAPDDRNLFRDYLDKTEAEIDRKISAAWTQFIAGDESSQRLFYPVGADMAYIADIGNGDVRSEGMSYGLMIAVQLDRRDEFDRLWRWAKKHMYHAEGPRRGYFAWHCRFDGTQIDPGSASDGEEWFAMALLFAANRWGASSPPSLSPSLSLLPVDYRAEAQALLRVMRDNDRGGEVTSIFDAHHRQVVFAPTRRASTFTDPSYHLPAFYELWARWDESPEGRVFWAACALESRAFFRRAAHPDTGLMPEYSHFDGRPYVGFGAERGDFRFDAWRMLANVALDHAWWAADPWQIEQSNRVLRFLVSQGPDFANQYTLEGRPLSTDTSTGLIAMAAVAGLAAERELAEPFVRRLWDAPVPEGKWRYYDGLLYMLGLLQAGGRFEVFHPVTPGN
jgi:oligosaccharide reducing-end xylanase